MIKYPETKKATVLDSYFGVQIEDPYRWLENDKSLEVKDWIKEQNEFTSNYLENIPYRKNIKDRLTKLWDYEKLGTPFEEGNYTYYYKNNGLQDQYVLYRRKDGYDEEVFLDPNNFSSDGTISLSGISFTKDGSLLAYSISEGGTDLKKVIVMNTKTKNIIKKAMIN